MRRLKREHGLAEPRLEDLGGFLDVTFYGPGERILDLMSSDSNLAFTVHIPASVMLLVEAAII